MDFSSDLRDRNLVWFQEKTLPTGSTCLSRGSRPMRWRTSRFTGGMLSWRGSRTTRLKARGETCLGQRRRKSSRRSEGWILFSSLHGLLRPRLRALMSRHFFVLSHHLSIFFLASLSSAPFLSPSLFLSVSFLFLPVRQPCATLEDSSAHMHTQDPGYLNQALHDASCPSSLLTCTRVSRFAGGTLRTPRTKRRGASGPAALWTWAAIRSSLSTLTRTSSCVSAPLRSVVQVLALNWSAKRCSFWYCKEICRIVIHCVRPTHPHSQPGILPPRSTDESLFDHTPISRAPDQGSWVTSSNPTHWRPGARIE